MHRSRKALDLLRDPRMELHSAPVFRVDINEVTLIRVGEPADRLLIESWSAKEGFRRIERR